MQNIIFDWDGTIGMTLHLWLAGYRSGLQNQGVEIPEAKIVSEFFYEHHKAEENYPQVDFDLLVEEAFAHLHLNLAELELYENAEETIVHLYEKGHTLALVTSSPRAVLNRGLLVHNLEKYFVSIIGGDEGFAYKPHPEPFNQTMKRIGARPQNTLIIGDARTDIVAGKAANTKTCLFAPAQNQLFHDVETLAKAGADFTISNFAELADLA